MYYLVPVAKLALIYYVPTASTSAEEVVNMVAVRSRARLPRDTY